MTKNRTLSSVEMITFRQFLLGEDESFEERSSRRDAEAIAETQACNRDFIDYNGVKWMSDDNYAADYKKYVLPTSNDMWRFKNWLVETFKITESNINIVLTTEYVNAYTKFEIKLNQKRFHIDDGFSYEMMMKTIGKTWDRLVPQIPLRNVTMTPAYSPATPTRVRYITATLSGNGLDKNLREKSFRPLDPESNEQHVKSALSHYAHHRRHAWHEIFFQSITGKKRNEGDRGESDVKL